MKKFLSVFLIGVMLSTPANAWYRGGWGYYGGYGGYGAALAGAAIGGAIAGVVVNSYSPNGYYYPSAVYAPPPRYYYAPVVPVESAPVQQQVIVHKHIHKYVKKNTIINSPGASIIEENDFFPW